METITPIIEKKKERKRETNHHHGAKRIKIKKNKMALYGLYVLIFMFYLVLSVQSFHHMLMEKYK